MWISMVFIVGLFIVLFIKGYKNTQHVVINHVSIDASRPSEDSMGDPLRILHLSDIHLERISITPDHLYERLKDQSIDLIALTGDFLDKKRSIPKLIPYLAILNKLNPTYGIYAVFGNHDYVLKQPNFLQLKRVLEENGCKTMQNENHVIMVNDKKLNIIGIDDFSTNRSDIDKSYEGLKEGLNLVLTHDPNLVLEMKDFPYDYLLSGHFHGGQIHWPKPYHLATMGKLVRMHMIKGLHKHYGKFFYINEGLGQSGVNVRFGSRPEITIHQLKLSSALIKTKKATEAI
ncbi:metallophosphoesterase [Terrilactibacillus laevilacticus]|uniref:Metallophosphoesterase n=1 Tax=Terrilactibacillus laevilacticus TaxID=1380157 RepID=A0ABW5PRH4_9BACI|nr:metallophosphoesterase [Terrilactibacillus laevilacticus]